ncbi:MAG TPA: hypothetical protein VFM05_04090, partial [Candidatus Saccharimonadales bacterium]|nr:hypothetical protein [Candidatus Saccharimonadales bacterium]
TTSKSKGISSAPPQPRTNKPAFTESGQVRSSNLRVKRSFSDEEVDQFLEESFEYISRFFEASLQELSERNSQITTRFRRVDSNSFSASIYDSGKRAAECTVWLGSRNSLQNGIAYSSGIIQSRNQYNELLSVGNDGYSLHLSALGMSIMGPRPAKEMSPEGAAELFWGMLIQRLQ